MTSTLRPMETPHKGKDRSTLAKESAAAQSTNHLSKESVMKHVIPGDPKWGAYAPGTRVEVVLKSGSLATATVINVSCVPLNNPDFVSLHIDNEDLLIEKRVHVSRVTPLEVVYTTEDHASRASGK